MVSVDSEGGLAEAIIMAASGVCRDTASEEATASITLQHGNRTPLRPVIDGPFLALMIVFEAMNGAVGGSTNKRSLKYFSMEWKG